MEHRGFLSKCKPNTDKFHYYRIRTSA